MARKSKKQRLEEQRVRQATVREEARQRRRPDRDDLARMMLWLAIRDAHAEAAKQRSQRPHDLLCGILADCLETQGFDVREIEDVYAKLEAKYRTQQMPCRIKRHLGRSPGDAAASGI
jgi:Cdc6-like AAA superfamily ATPase